MVRSPARSGKRAHLVASETSQMCPSDRRVAHDLTRLVVGEERTLHEVGHVGLVSSILVRHDAARLEVPVRVDAEEDLFAHGGRGLVDGRVEEVRGAARRDLRQLWIDGHLLFRRRPRSERLELLHQTFPGIEGREVERVREPGRHLRLLGSRALGSLAGGDDRDRHGAGRIAHAADAHAGPSDVIRSPRAPRRAST